MPEGALPAGYAGCGRAYHHGKTMKPSIQSRLERLVERFEEVSALLSDASVISNQDKFRELSREFAEIEPVVKCFQSWQQSLDDISEAKELLKDGDRKSTRLNSSHVRISYAVFCLKKKKKKREKKE